MSPEHGGLLSPARAIVSSGPAQSIVFLTIVGALWILFFRGITALRRGASVGMGAIVLGGALLAAPHLVSLPTLCLDVTAYLTIGEAIDAGAENPYKFEQTDLQGLKTRRYAQHIHGGSIYGPLSTRVFQWVHRPARSVYENILAMRTTFFVFYVISALLLSALIRTLPIDDSQARSKLAFFSLCPLVIIELIWGVHLDAVATLLLTVGMLFISKKHHAVGAVLIGGLAAIRATFGFFWPTLAIYVSRRNDGSLSPWRMMGFVAASVAFFAMWLLPSWTTANPLGPMMTLTKLDGTTLSFIFKSLARSFGIRGYVISLLMNGLFAVILLRRATRLKRREDLNHHLAGDCLIYFLFFMPWTHSWYFVTAYPLVVMSGSERYARVLATASVGMLCGYYGIDFAVNDWNSGTRMDIYAVGLLPASILMLLPERGNSSKLSSEGDGPTVRGGQPEFVP